MSCVHLIRDSEDSFESEPTKTKPIFGFLLVIMLNTRKSIFIDDQLVKITETIYALCNGMGASISANIFDSDSC